jgi:hypothetical protein
MSELRKAMRLIYALVAVAFATPAYSQTLEQQEQMNQLERAISKLDQLKTAVETMGQERRSQCMAAVASEAFCECLGQKLPVVINFVDYVTIVVRTREELKYNTLSAEDKGVVDNTRKVRDQCVGQVARPSPAARKPATPK